MYVSVYIYVCIPRLAVFPSPPPCRPSSWWRPPAAAPGLQRPCAAYQPVYVDRIYNRIKLCMTQNTGVMP